MGWGRMDDRFDEHPKVIAILDEEDPFVAAMAIATWTVCFTWAHRNTRKRGQTPGLIPPGLPKRYFGRDAKAGIELLVKHGMWDPHESGGWLFHDFQEYLPTDETRDARSEAGKRGAAKRWANRGGEGGSTPTLDGKLPSPDSNEPSVCHDADGKRIASDGNADGKPMASDGSRTPARRAIPKGIAPVPIPVQPSAGDASPSPAAKGLSITQRSKRITDAYASVEPMCKWPAINGIVIRAIKAEKWSDDEIRDALLRMAEVNRPVTVDSLRTELGGLPPASSRASPINRPYTTPASTAPVAMSDEERCPQHRGERKGRCRQCAANAKASPQGSVA